MRRNPNADEPLVPYPRDKEQILRDFTVAGRLKDIRDMARLKERLAPKWWEASILVIQFIAALGLLASVLLYPPLSSTMLGRFLIFWLALTVLSLILGFELVILRMHHLRQAFQVSTSMVEDLAKRVNELEAKGGESVKDDEGRGEKAGHAQGDH